MGKIFKIEVKTTVYFYGESLPNSFELAEAVQEEIELLNYDQCAADVTQDDLSMLDKDILSIYPYGKGGDRKTIAEWLENV